MKSLRRPGFYSVKAEDSIYPIKAGNVLEIIEPVKYFFRKKNKYYKCKLFIWILRESTVRRRFMPPKRRMISVQHYYQLLLSEDGLKYIMPPSRDVQFESVTETIRRGGGYKLVAEKVRYNYRLEDVAKFFNSIGAI